MRRFATLAVATVIALSTLTGTAHAPPLPGTCATTKTKNYTSNVTAEIVRYGSVDRYQITTGATGSVAVWSPGDIDLAVCKPGAAPTCTSTNPAGVVDACPAFGAGTWIVMIAHCTDPDCGYPEQANVKVDLPYVFAWTS